MTYNFRNIQRRTYEQPRNACETYGNSYMFQSIPAIGLLSAVSGLVALPQRGAINLTWTPPFSLDITGVDPDLWYRVEVYNITSGRTPLTNLTVSEPEFNFTVPHPSPYCDQFEFRVTPVNGAGDGTTSEPVRGCFLRSKLHSYHKDLIFRKDTHY